MPQFDIVAFMVQIFFSFAFLIAFYLFTLKYVIVRIAEVIKMRKKLKKYTEQENLKAKASKLSTSALYDAVMKEVTKF